jgi:hypothetical protein
MSIVFAVLLQVAPVAPVALPVRGPADAVHIDCMLRDQATGNSTRIVANLLAEDHNMPPKSDIRSREIVITQGPRGMLGKHVYSWRAYLGTYHEIQIDDYNLHEDYLLTLQIPKSHAPAGAMLYNWRQPDTVGVGYCTHTQDPS